MSFDCLDAEATQTGFAVLVGISQPAVNGRVRSGQFRKGGTYWEWLLAYVEDLREKAAGRDGDDQAEFRKARTEDMQATAAIKRMQAHEKAGGLVVKAESHALLAGWATFSSREFAGAVDRLVADIESQFGVSVPQDVREKHAATAIRRVRDYGLQPGEDRGGGGGVVSAAPTGTDG